MADICIKVPDELKEQVEQSSLDWPSLLKQFITLKLFEKQLSESTALQRAVFESLISRSKLTEEDAKLLSDKINTGMSEEIESLKS